MPTSHIPRAIEGAEMDKTTTRLRASLNSTLVMKLYDHLNALPIPMFVGQRMKLPCISFKLGHLSASRYESGHVFRAKADALGVVEIRTTEDLSRLDSLILVHPWVDFLLDRQPVGSIIQTTPEENTDNPSFMLGDLSSLPLPSNTTSVAKRTRGAWIAARLGLPFGARPRDAASLLSPSPLSLTDRRTQAFRLVARLRQPFGTLLFTQTRQNAEGPRLVLFIASLFSLLLHSSKHFLVRITGT